MSDFNSDLARNGLNERIEELYQTSGVGLVVETLAERIADALADGLDDDPARVQRTSLNEFKRLLADELYARRETDPDDSAISCAVG
jgi:hypothetical protein